MLLDLVVVVGGGGGGAGGGQGGWTGGGFVEFFHESWRLTSSSSKESCRPTSKEKPEEVRGRCGGSSGGRYSSISESDESVVMRARRARLTSFGGEWSGALSGGGVSRSRGSPSKDQVRGSPGDARPERGALFGPARPRQQRHQRNKARLVFGSFVGEETEPQRQQD